MSFPVSSFGRTCLMAGLLALALSACGRRGPPEAPPEVSVAPAPQRGARTSLATPAGGPGPSQAAGELDDDDDVETAPVVVPNPRPARNAKRGYTIPKEPFILDPLL